MMCCRVYVCRLVCYAARARVGGGSGDATRGGQQHTFTSTAVELYKEHGQGRPFYSHATRFRAQLKVRPEGNACFFSLVVDDDSDG